MNEIDQKIQEVENALKSRNGGKMPCENEMKKTDFRYQMN